MVFLALAAPAAFLTLRRAADFCFELDMTASLRIVRSFYQQPLADHRTMPHKFVGVVDAAWL
jgi:hypothetical protein